MDNRKIFEKLGVQYEEKDGLLYPVITMDQEPTDIGKFGILWIEFMKVKYPNRYLSLKQSDRLREKAYEVNEEAYKLLDMITAGYLNEHKPKDPSSTMEMWRLREAAKVTAEEIVLDQIVHRYS